MTEFNLNNVLPDEGLPAVETTAGFPWSIMQQDIFTACRETKLNLSVEAVAGSGKTTTLVEAINACNTGNAIFLAFNKAIADTLRLKVPMGCEARTFHSLGLSVLRPFLPDGSQMEANKDRKIVQTGLSKPAFDTIGYDCMRLIASAKNHCLGIDQAVHRGDFIELMENQDIYFDEEYRDMALTMLPDWFEQSASLENGLFDYNDMIYQPIKLGLTFPMFEVVFVDEAQDLNHLQHVTLERLHDAGSRIICVGDSHQAIYGFRGAMHESMDLLADMFHAHLYPLSVSYRCPLAVVAEAQRYVPHIEPAEGAKDGIVEYLELEPDIHSYKDGDMILCRNNFPLFQLGMDMLKERIHCQLRTNHGKELIGFVKKFQATSTSELRNGLNKWYRVSMDEAEEKKQYAKQSYIEERYAILHPFCDAYNTVEQIIRALNALLHSKRGPILSTVHKAKGLEAERVFILRPDLIPSKYAKSDDQIKQEYNLLYVAITRSLSELYFLPGQDE